MSWVRTKLTFSNGIAFVALFAVLGGGAYAASKVGPKDIKKNAVRSAHIKNKQVKGADIRRGAVRTGKLANGAVAGSKLGSIIEVIESNQVPPNSQRDAVATCPAGTQVISGGGATNLSTSAITRTRMQFDSSGPGGWAVTVANGGSGADSVEARAYCLE